MKNINMNQQSRIYLRMYSKHEAQTVVRRLLQQGAKLISWLFRQVRWQRWSTIKTMFRRWRRGWSAVCLQMLTSDPETWWSASRSWTLRRPPRGTPDLNFPSAQCCRSDWLANRTSCFLPECTEWCVNVCINMDVLSDCIVLTIK